MILDDCQQLVKLARNVTDLKSNVNELNNFQTRQAEIEKIVNDLIPLVKSFQVFKARGICNFALLAEVENFLTLVIEIESQFKVDRKWLIGAKKIKPLQDKAKILRDEFDQQLRRNWTNYRNSNVPSISNDLLSVLEKIPKFLNAVTTVSTLSSRIRAIDYPKNQVQFERVAEEITQLNSAWSSLNSDEVPLDVLNFLRESATTNGASMNLLTPTVQEWLDSQGIGSSFRIRLG